MSEMDAERWMAFKYELSDLFNKHSLDTELNTPDFLLAESVVAYLGLVLYPTMVVRDKWFGDQ